MYNLSNPLDEMKKSGFKILTNYQNLTSRRSNVLGKCVYENNYRKVFELC